KPAAQDALYEVNAYRTSDHDPVVVGLNLNAPPVATPDSATVAKNSSVVIFALDNDFDLDGDTLTVVSHSQGAHGTVKYSLKNNNFRYTPARGFRGTDTFTYTISDGKGHTATTTVTITVE
ncbi:MAG TPA: Ig-like domain-containing protein, partial [Anaerolineales bacterium]|nr:Ig-like domain-containing protein [Anaerolineales bacterium]